MMELFFSQHFRVEKLVGEDNRINKDFVFDEMKDDAITSHRQLTIARMFRNSGASAGLHASEDAAFSNLRPNDMAREGAVSMICATIS